MPAPLHMRRVILSKRPAAVASIATLSAPFNSLVAYGPGDSRTAQGGGLSGTYNTAGGVGNGYGQGVDAFLATMLGNRARFIDYQRNPGIGGQTGAQALAYPRPIGVGAWTGRIDNGTAGNAGNTLTITAIAGGDQITVGNRITGTGVIPCIVTAFGTGTGGTGTYTVDGTAQNLASTATIQPQYVYGQTAAKTITDVAANQAAIVILGPLGTNSSGSAADLAAMGTAIRALTDPTYVYPGYGAVLPLYNGQPKTIILLNDTRVGFNTTGVAGNGKSGATALQFYNYALSLLKYGYDSGDALANPHVVAIDTFNDPVLADLTDTTNYACKPGFFADGLHFAPPGAYQVARRIAAKVTPLLAVYDYARLPTTTTTASFLNANPVLATTTGGASALSAGVTFTGTIPSGYRLLSTGGSGLNIDLSYNALGGTLGNELVIRITGTPATNGTVTFDQLVGSTARATVNLATDAVRMAWRSKLLVTAGNVYVQNAGVTLQAASSLNRQMGASTGAAGTALGYGNVAANALWVKNAYASTEHAAYATEVTRNAALAQYGETGNPTLLQLSYNVSVQAGVAVDVTLTLSQIGVAKVTD